MTGRCRYIHAAVSETATKFMWGKCVGNLMQNILDTGHSRRFSYASCAVSTVPGCARSILAAYPLSTHIRPPLCYNVQNTTEGVLCLACLTGGLQVSHVSACMCWAKIRREFSDSGPPFGL